MSNLDDVSVVVPLYEYKELLRDSLFLEILRGNGIDNWEGYEYAVDDFHKALEENPELKEEE